MSTALTRLAPGGGVLGIMTFWNEDDWAGRIQQVMATGDGDKFEIVKYPAINETGDEYMRSQDFHIEDVSDPAMIDKILEERPSLYMSAGSLSKELFAKVSNKMKEKGIYNEFIASRNYVSDIFHMWRAGDMTNEQVKEKIPDVIIRKIADDTQDNWYIPVKGDDLSDLAFLYADDDSDNNKSSSQDLIKSHNDNNFYDSSWAGWQDAEDALDDLTDEQVGELLQKLENEIGEKPSWEFYRDEFEAESWFDEEADFAAVMKSNRDALKQVIGTDEECKDFIIRVYEEAHAYASEAEAWKDYVKPLSEFGISHSKLFQTYHEKDHFLIPFSVGMAKQTEPYYSLYGGSGSEYLNKNTPLDSMLRNLYDFDDMGVDEDEADFKPLSIDMPYYGWSESPNPEQIRDSFNNRQDW
jgi:hypothetical protein